jgi:hypothetical protein
MKHLRQDLYEKSFKAAIILMAFILGYLIGNNFYLKEKIETRFMLRTCVELNNDAMSRLATCINPLPKRQ